MIKDAIVKIVDKQDLSYDEAYQVMDEIMSGQTSATQNAAFLAALSTKSTKAETIEEISGCAAAMRNKAIQVNYDRPALEIVGTGGDGAHSFNISTTASFIIAAAGIPVAKHGNRAASSLSGAADCYEALGASLEIPPEKAVAMLDRVGLCFLFAQKYHIAMKYVGAIRKELGIRTVFNILGPLTNPASPEYFVLGVYDQYLVEPIAKVLARLGVRHAAVIYGQDRLDEVSISAPTTICELNDGWYKTYTICPEDFGLARGRKEDIVGGTPQENAELTRNILSGREKGPKRDIVLMNAGLAIYIGGAADSIADGIQKAAELIDNGSASKKLDEFVAASNATD